MNPLRYRNTKVRILLIPLLMAPLLLTGPAKSMADIYRFVTIDGVETFTDAPVTKQARLVIKETTPQKKKKKKTTAKEQVHTISINDIADRTVQSSINPPSGETGSSFIPRLPPVGGIITSGVGVRVDPIDGKYRHHNGIDIAISEGTQVTPAAPGIVVYSGQRSGYGNTVLIEHENGLVTLYGHNSRLLVSSGQMVTQETVIALSGNTGRSTGPHLHFEAWQAGVNVTPSFMPGNNAPLPKLRLASHATGSHFHREILQDGSILFTNIPSSGKR